jgi:hypothetical protein
MMYTIALHCCDDVEFLHVQKSLSTSIQSKQKKDLKKSSLLILETW